MNGKHKSFGSAGENQKTYMDEEEKKTLPLSHSKGNLSPSDVREKKKAPPPKHPPPITEENRNINRRDYLPPFNLLWIKLDGLWTELIPNFLVMMVVRAFDELLHCFLMVCIVAYHSENVQEFNGPSSFGGNNYISPANNDRNNNKGLCYFREDEALATAQHRNAYQHLTVEGVSELTGEARSLNLT
ncbi:hypothetical protein E2C01_025761 [Portunus trituberculatus]|uniref:Uncharacterized protein n=1 Tax=Portunus trituberculatus TaxID=210409 RepID=A0A5B7EDT1_PORTR|nr:hypothetical protein [Portunus trituberculatus]